MTRAMKNILTADNDLGFILWLGAVLTSFTSDGDRQELEEFQRIEFVAARSRYERDRTEENKRVYWDALHRFADLVLHGATAGA